MHDLVFFRREGGEEWGGGGKGAPVWGSPGGRMKEVHEGNRKLTDRNSVTGPLKLLGKGKN